MTEDDFFRAEQLSEIVSGETDAPLRQIKSEIKPHRPAEPRIGSAFRRPRTFDQAAEHDAVAIGEARFDGAENTHARARTRRRPNNTVGECGDEQLNVVGRIDHQRGGGFARCQFVERVCKI